MPVVLPLSVGPPYTLIKLPVWAARSLVSLGVAVGLADSSTVPPTGSPPCSIQGPGQVGAELAELPAVWGPQLHAHDPAICCRDSGHSHAPGKWLSLLLCRSRHTDSGGNCTVTFSTALCQTALGVAQREMGGLTGARQTGRWTGEVPGFLGHRDEGTRLLGD